MIRARGDRRWYLAYQAENEQFKISCPVTGGKVIAELRTKMRVDEGRTTDDRVDHQKLCVLRDQKSWESSKDCCNR
jgi:hypothetical protein